jgi:Protein of unknown function (DUF2442)
VEQVIDVTAARILARYVVELTFESGETKVIDLEPLLHGPVFQPLVDDYALFAQLHVDPTAGTIEWSNGADILPRTLYRRSREIVSS